MIISFKDKDTENFYHGFKSVKFPHEIKERALIKLDFLNSAHILEDLKTLPGNKLEKLTGNLKNFHSIRINEKYRIIFVWENGNAYQVSITDYH